MSENCSSILKTSAFGLCLLLITSACQRDSDNGAASSKSNINSLPVIVSANFPLHEFTSRIGGALVETSFLVPAGIDPAFWRPDSESIEVLQNADRIVLNGAGYERWLMTTSLSDRKLIDTSKSFHDRYIVEGSGVTHQHGPSGEHTHGAIAFTIWMDLSLAIEQAIAIEKALTKILPEDESTFSENLRALVSELSDLDTGFVEWGKELNGQALIGSHPVYQYFTRRYGLNLKSVHWEPDEIPSQSALRELDMLLEEHPAKWMIWEAAPLTESIALLEERGVKSVTISPQGNRSSEASFLNEMQANLARAKGMID